MPVFASIWVMAVMVVMAMDITLRVIMAIADMVMAIPFMGIADTIVPIHYTEPIASSAAIKGVTVTGAIAITGVTDIIGVIRSSRAAITRFRSGDGASTRIQSIPFTGQGATPSGQFVCVVSVLPIIPHSTSFRQPACLRRYRYCRQASGTFRPFPQGLPASR